MTTLEAQHEVITNLILENQKLKQERDEAKVAIRALAEHGESEIQRITKERDEARNKMADALQEVDLRTLDFERMNQECYGLRKELEEYRSIAENIGALKAVSEKEKAIRERDEAREEWGKASMDAAQLLSEKTKVIAECEEVREALMAIEDRCVDCEDACDDIQKIRDIAREALEK